MGRRASEVQCVSFFFAGGDVLCAFFALTVQCEKKIPHQFLGIVNVKGRCRP